MKWFLKCLTQYADFSGRARRKEFWFFQLFTGIIYFIIYIGLFKPLFLLINSGEELDQTELLASMLGNPFIYALLIAWLAFIVPTLAVQVRRLHDIGKSGYWLFLLYGAQFVASMAPTQAIIENLAVLAVSCLFIFFYFKDSEYGPNQYGPNPKDLGNSTQESHPTEDPTN